MTNRVFVLSSTKVPLMPCHPARARELLKTKRAAVFRKFPFTIILKDRSEGSIQDLIIKIDPGSKTTGLSLILNGKKGFKAIAGFNLIHRGNQIKLDLITRSQARRTRRSRLRYRKPRFNNRTKPNGWLPPSLQSRVSNIETWVNRFILLSPVSSISIEMTSFDIQKMNNPNIQNCEYQKGDLFNFEIREYILSRDNYQCQYCGIKDKGMELDHIIPKSKGGSNSIKNLVCSCRKCNLMKSNKLLNDWILELQKSNSKNSQLMLKGAIKVNIGKRKLFKDAAIVQSYKNVLLNKLKDIGLYVETSFGYITKYNRVNQGFNKDHWIDSVCIGNTGSNVFIPKYITPLYIQAIKTQDREMVRKHNQLKNKPPMNPKSNSHKDIFKTGDIIKAIIPKGVNRGTHIGKCGVITGNQITLSNPGKKQLFINPKHCKKVHSKDGYNYNRIINIITENTINRFKDIKNIVKNNFDIINIVLINDNLIINNLLIKKYKCIYYLNDINQI